MKKLFENKPRAWFILGSIFVFLITIFAVSYFGLGTSALVSNDVVAKIDGEKILLADFKSWLYKLDYNGSSSQPTRWEEIKADEKLKKSYLDMFIKEKLYGKEAEEAGLKVTEEEVNNRYNVPGSNYEKLTEEQKILSRESSMAALLAQKLEEDALGWVAGEYIFYRFDKYYEYEDDMPKVAGAGEINLINKQKQYAAGKASEAYNNLSTNKNSFDEEIKRIEGDAEISFKAFAPLTPNIYGKTTKDEYINNRDLFDELRYTGFKENIEGLKLNEVARPFIAQTIANGKMQDFAYVVYKATEAKIGRYSNKAEWYAELLIRHKVEVYYSNLGIKTEKDVKYSLKNFLKVVIPEAEAACPPVYTSTMRWTEMWGQLLVFIPDGVNYYAYPGAKFRLAAGNDNADAKLMVFNGDCSAVTSWVHEAFKYAEDDGSYSGLMAGSGYYGVAGAGDQMPVLAHCGSTSTANLGVYAPSNPAWLSGAGTLGISYRSCCGDGGVNSGDFVNELHWKVNMQNYNGRTIHYQFTYRPLYNNAPTVNPTGSARNRTFTTTESINLSALTNDVDAGDQVNTRIAIAKQAADGSWNGWAEGWKYYETGYVAPGVDRTIKSFIPASTLGVGKYKWVVTAHDWHEVYNVNPPGSPNSYNHNDPWLFEIADPVTLEQLSCSVEPPEGGPVPLSVNVRVNNPRSGFAYSYDFENDGVYEYKNQSSITSWSYPKSGYYQIRVTEGTVGVDPSCADALRCAVCTPSPYPVTAEPGGTGGEVAP